MTREPIGPNDAMDRLLERRLRRLPVPVESGSLCADAATLASFVDGDLEEDERVRWEAHFASCATCRQTLRVLVASAPADAVAAGPVGIVRPHDVASSARPAAGEPATEVVSAPASETAVLAVAVAGAATPAPAGTRGPQAAQRPLGAEGTPSSESARTTASDDARPSSAWGARTWIALAASLVAAAGLWLTVRSTPSLSQPETMQVATGTQSPASDVPPEGRARGTEAFSGAPSRVAPSQVPPADVAPSQAAPARGRGAQAESALSKAAPSQSAPSQAATAASAAADRFARAEPVERDAQRARAAASAPKPVAGAAGAGAASGGRRDERIADSRSGLASTAKPSSSSPELAERAAPPPAPGAIPAPSVARSAESRQEKAEGESLALAAQAAAPATTRDTAVNQRAAAAAPAVATPAAPEAARVAKSQPGASAPAQAAAQSGGAASGTSAARPAGEPATAAAASADLDASRAAKVGTLARARGDAANSAISPAAARAFASPDGARAWRFAGPGVIVTSTDGERSWQTEFSDPALRLNAGRAVSSIICWVVGADGLVLRRDETGRWNRVAALPIAADLRVVLAASDTSATVMAVDGTSYRTQDRGRTWQALPAVAPPAAARPRPE